MIYGHNKTIHGTQKLNVEIDKRGGVVSVWFRCCPLAFTQTVVDESRAAEMRAIAGQKIVAVETADVDTSANRLRRSLGSPWEG